MTQNKDKGYLLQELPADETARFVARLWDNYSMTRRNALTLCDEVRQYIFATDIDTTSAANLAHKNRTHLPKLAEISDRLQFNYWNALFSRPDFFHYEAANADKHLARKITTLVRKKLEQQKFRQGVGRELVADYVITGNAFAGVSYCNKEINGVTVYKGPLIYRRGVHDVVMNPSAPSFASSPKIERELIHIGDILQFPEKYPNSRWNEDALAKIRKSREPGFIEDWIDAVKQSNLKFDGYSSLDNYFTQDHAEVLMYRGDVWNSETGELDKNRVVMVVDKMWVIRDEYNPSPTGFDGLHHAPWRIRPDNLWGMGPLDNLVGMQYRIDHLENLKADVFDLVVSPPLKVRGDEVDMPSSFAPGAVYYLGSSEDADVEVMSPNVQALAADNEIAYYSQLMEQFVGAPPQKSGIRTPGEKTAFEVNVLESNSTEMFLDKVRILEAMIENVLQEVLEIVLLNFDETEHLEFVDPETGTRTIEELRLADIQDIRGRFVATGSYYWEKNRRRAQELVTFYSSGAANDPKIRMHLNGWDLAKYWEERLELHDTGIFEEFAGVKEDVLAQAIAQFEMQEMAQGGQQIGGPPDASVSPVQQGRPGTQPTQI